MKITKECIIDILSVLGGKKSEFFEIRFDNEKYILPDIGVYDIKDFFDDKYSFETISYCCLLLFEEGYIKATIKSDSEPYRHHHSFMIDYLHGLTLKGYEYLEKLNSEL